MAEDKIPSDDPNLNNASAAEEDFEDEEYEDEPIEPSRMGEILRVALPGWLVSALVNMTMILILMAFYLPRVVDSNSDLIASPGEDSPLEELDTFDDEPFEEIDVELTDTAVFESTDVVADDIDFSVFDEASAMTQMPLFETGTDPLNAQNLMAATPTFGGGNALSGRGSGKGTLLAQGGGSEGSERAVALALAWLAEHQCPDGGWNFDLKNCPTCKGQCKNSGDTGQARNAATGLALLPFLGAGQTHQKGKYAKTVDRGLYFLLNRGKRSPQGVSYYEDGGRMYSHGICAIAICEAYGMTRDQRLYQPAQGVCNFIVNAQDPIGGGWRYEPRQAGDTSVVGWQLMALKSGRMAYLEIPDVAFQRAYRFLDSVQADGGAKYGYMTPGDKDATTSIGLLCRMYLGWKHDHQPLQKGVNFLVNKGPSKSDAYYNYYATQVARHFEGEQWEKWNSVMRDQLVNSQVQKGHETGSWYFGDGNHNEKGGRLYCTAMSTMVLEVYYRHLPIYRKQITEEEFEID